MNYVTYIVDGFNLYHSVRDASIIHQVSTKWLNLHSLCQSYLQLLGRNRVLKAIYYFTALATHLNDPNVIKRHEAYIKCLEDTGVVVSRSEFKEVEDYCPLCRRYFKHHKEKQTDVAMASKIFEVLGNDECDTVVLLTGDTDLIPALETTMRLFTNKEILCAFPFARKHKHLAQLSPKSFKISCKAYCSNQFPDPYTLRDGTSINKPLTW